MALPVAATPLPTALTTEEEWLTFFTDAGIPDAHASSYSEVFADNRIRMDMVMDLSKEILQEMGVAVMGDVIAILKQAKVVHQRNVHARQAEVRKREIALRRSMEMRQIQEQLLAARHEAEVAAAKQKKRPATAGDNTGFKGPEVQKRRKTAAAQAKKQEPDPEELEPELEEPVGRPAAKPKAATVSRLKPAPATKASTRPPKQHQAAIARKKAPAPQPKAQTGIYARLSQTSGMKKRAGPQRTVAVVDEGKGDMGQDSATVFARLSSSRKVTRPTAKPAKPTKPRQASGYGPLPNKHSLV